MVSPWPSLSKGKSTRLTCGEHIGYVLALSSIKRCYMPNEPARKGVYTRELLWHISCV